MAKLGYWISFILFLIFLVSTIIIGLQSQFLVMGEMIGLSIIWYALWRIWADLRELN